eukprot:4329045-Pleurochrysis_carterae.AAC.1
MEPALARTRHSASGHALLDDLFKGAPPRVAAPFPQALALRGRWHPDDLRRVGHFRTKASELCACPHRD